MSFFTLFLIADAIRNRVKNPVMYCSKLRSTNHHGILHCAYCRIRVNKLRSEWHVDPGLLRRTKILLAMTLFVLTIDEWRFTANLPCIRLRRLSVRSWKDHIEFLIGLVGKFYFKRSETTYKLFFRSRTDNGRSDSFILKQPCQRNVSRFFAYVFAQQFISGNFLFLFFDPRMH